MPLTPGQLTDLQDSLKVDLLQFAPELVLIGTILGLLLVRLIPRYAKVHLAAIALGGCAAALFAVLAPQFGMLATPPGDATAFTGLLALDPFAHFLRALLLGFAVLAVLFTRITGIPDAEDSADFYVLLLGGTLGMMVMVSANHLVMVFIGVEMASLPSYALSGFLKGRRQGSEAAIKYVVYGAAASGVMLYGISLLAGACGSGQFAVVAANCAKALQSGEFPPILATGLFFLLVGFAFKLGAVPFHFWVPDVFEGAAAEVGAFLSVASKAAAVGLAARFLLTLQSAATDPTLLAGTVGLGVLAVAAVTATFGNLVALAQTNLKRLLAYSTIAHAGYMTMALATLTRDGAASVLFYLVAYLLMNLGAFAVVAVVRNRTGGETIDHCRGLMSRSPAVAICLTIFLLSLLGLPPLAGFAGKFQVFAAVYDAGQVYAHHGRPDLGMAYNILLGVGVVNTVISAGYYLRILRAAGLDEPAEKDEKGNALPLGEPADARVFLILLAIGIVGLGIVWGPLASFAERAVKVFAHAP